MKILYIAIFTFIFTACSTKETSLYIDDSLITYNIKVQMLHDNELKASAITVNTEKGVVQLSGFVSNNRQRIIAIRIASGIKGVKKIYADLRYKP